MSKVLVKVTPEQSKEAQEILYRNGFLLQGDSSVECQPSGYNYLAVDSLSERIYFSSNESWAEIISFKKWRKAFLKAHEPQAYIALMKAKLCKIQNRIHSLDGVFLGLKTNTAITIGGGGGGAGDLPVGCGGSDVGYVGEVTKPAVDQYQLKGGDWAFGVVGVRHTGLSDVAATYYGIRRDKEQAAIEARKFIGGIQRMLAYAYEHDGLLGFMEDIENYMVVVNVLTGRYEVSSSKNLKTGSVYMTRECAYHLASDLNNGRFTLDIEEPQ